MAGKISELTNMNGAATIDRTADFLELTDTSAGTSYKVTPNFMLGFTGGSPVSTSDTQTLTSKTLTAPTISSPVLSGTITGTYTLAGTPTFPATIVSTTGTQTLTNKTITSATIATPTITNASITQDAVTGFTSANTGTVYGVAITAGVITGSSTIPTAAIQADAITAAKMLNGQIYRRQGGSATNWDTVGTTTFDVSASDVRIQVGSSTTGGNGSTNAITFPVAYTNTPIILVSAYSSAAAYPTYYIVIPTNTGFTVQVGVNVSSFQWMAVGI